MPDDAFVPDAITVAPGTTVTFVLKNTGVNFHNMRILSKEALGKEYVSTTIAGGKSGTLQLTFPTAGAFKFQCDFHLANMLGTITVR